MNVHLLQFGKLKDRAIKEKVDHYIAALTRLATVSQHALKEEKITKKSNTHAALKIEGQRILQVCKQKPGKLIALDEHGQQFTSGSFAARLSRFKNENCRHLYFVTGSAYGIAPEVKKAADMTLALSTMTLPHELAYLILCEQLYRAQAIIDNLPYHHA